MVDRKNVRGRVAGVAAGVPRRIYLNLFIQREPRLDYGNGCVSRRIVYLGFSTRFGVSPRQ